MAHQLLDDLERNASLVGQRQQAAQNREDVVDRLQAQPRRRGFAMLGVAVGVEAERPIKRIEPRRHDHLTILGIPHEVQATSP
ncbi:MAG: hypothetical protein Q8L48_11670 [Archangium sp.]|nr:hypothetical protein [Archangium sp.]